MAKVRAKKKITEEKFLFPLNKTNFIIIIFGVIILAIGYILMAIPDDPDAFISRTLSPILLVFAYLVVIPTGLFYRAKKDGKR